MKPLAATIATAALLAVTGCTGPGTAATGTIPVPSSWTATQIAGKPTITGSAVTLEFADGGKVSGAATCNRFAGTATLAGVALKFGPLAVTRMACVGEGLNEQESTYLAALAAANHVAITGDTLEISGPGSAPVRFRRSIP